MTTASNELRAEWLAACAVVNKAWNAMHDATVQTADQVND